MTHVFVSYVRDNEAEVQTLVDALRRSGVHVWFDRDSLQAGSRWQEAIAGAIRSGAYVIACFSREFAARSHTYMQEELAVVRAMLRDPTAPGHLWCLPVLVGGGSANDAGLADDPDFGPLHTIDFHRDPVEAIRQLLATVSPERATGRCLNALPAMAAAPRDGVALLALDFGTSNSLLAAADRDLGWIPVRDAEGRIYLPTAVTFADNWDYWVGSEAVSAAYRRPDRCVAGVKRLLARGEEAHVGHKRLDAVTLASLVLRHMRECAVRQFGRDIRDVVIAAPAEYTTTQMKAVMRACERAGFHVARFVPEPNAAAMLAASWLENRPDLLDKTSEDPSATVLIIDVGGGTTDVSALEVAWVDTEWQFEVLATFGDNELGGLDYDEALGNHVRSVLFDGTRGSGLVWAPSDDARLLDLARQVKERLGTTSMAAITLPDVQTSDGEMRTLSIEVDREMAKLAFEPIDAKLRRIVNAAAFELEREFDTWAGHGLQRRLQGILLAGQGSKLWTIVDFLAERFPATEIETKFQESAVCRGLVLQSAVMAAQRKDMLLLDATTFTIGMRYSRQVDRLRDGPSFYVDPVPANNPHIAELVRYNTTIPTKFSQSFSTSGPGLLSFEVVELDRIGKVVGVMATLSLQLEPGRRLLDVAIDIWADRRMAFHLLDKRLPVATATLALSSSPSH